MKRDEKPSRRTLLLYGFSVLLVAAVGFTAVWDTPTVTLSDLTGSTVTYRRTETTTTTTALPAILSLNKATKEELTTLPGIGEVIASRIIEYREEHGAFSSVDELVNVSGIGEKKLEAIRELITVE